MSDRKRGLRGWKVVASAVVAGAVIAVLTLLWMKGGSGRGALERNEEGQAREGAVQAGAAVDDAGEVRVEVEVDIAAEMSQEIKEEVTKADERPIRPHARKRDFNAALSGETIEETVANLKDTFDYIVAFTSHGGAEGNQNCDTKPFIATRLMRVRKLLLAAQSEPERVRRLVMAAYTEDLAEWPKANADFMSYFMPGKPVPEDVKAAKDECFIRTIGTTYLLVETGAHEMLPLMVRCYRLHDKEKRLHLAPTPPGYTFYAIHRLIGSFPEGELGEESRGLRDEYLEAAKDVPEPLVIDVLYWNDEYSESDPRITMLDPAKTTIRGHKTMKMNLWPYAFEDGTMFNSLDGFLAEETKRLFKLQEAFVRCQFPEAGTSRLL